MVSVTPILQIRTPKLREGLPRTIERQQQDSDQLVGGQVQHYGSRRSLETCLTVAGRREGKDISKTAF